MIRASLIISRVCPRCRSEYLLEKRGAWDIFGLGARVFSLVQFGRGVLPEIEWFSSNQRKGNELEFGLAQLALF